MIFSSEVQVAMKKAKTNENDDGISATTIREVAVLKELQHPNIVR